MRFHRAACAAVLLVTVLATASSAADTAADSFRRQLPRGSDHRRTLRTGSSVRAQGGDPASIYSMSSSSLFATHCVDDENLHLYQVGESCWNIPDGVAGPDWPDQHDEAGWVQKYGCAFYPEGGRAMVADLCPFSCFHCIESQDWDALNRVFMDVVIAIPPIPVEIADEVSVTLNDLVCKDLSVGNFDIATTGPTATGPAGDPAEKVTVEVLAQNVMITCSLHVDWRVLSFTGTITAEISTTTTRVDTSLLFEAYDFSTDLPVVASEKPTCAVNLGPLTGPQITGASFVSKLGRVAMQISDVEAIVQDKLAVLIQDLLCGEVLDLGTAALQSALVSAKDAGVQYGCLPRDSPVSESDAAGNSWRKPTCSMPPSMPPSPPLESLEQSALADAAPETQATLLDLNHTFVARVATTLLNEFIGSNSTR
jgi:hypothetical protein